MIEKVSRAIIACGKAENVSPEDYARAALAALREPDEKMLEAAGNCETTVVTFDHNYTDCVSEKTAAAVWRAMIDAALKPE